MLDPLMNWSLDGPQPPKKPSAKPSLTLSEALQVSIVERSASVSPSDQGRVEPSFQKWFSRGGVANRLARSDSDWELSRSLEQVFPKDSGDVRPPSKMLSS